MGALLSVCGMGQLACCAASTACSCLNCITPAIGARIMYSFMLLLVTITGWIMTLPNVSDWLQTKLPFCWTKPTMLKDWQHSVSNYFGSDSTTRPPPTTICEKITGYLAVYRLMFATFLFFTVLGVIMLKVRNARDPRVALHRGIWPIKFLLLIGIIIGAFYIPGDSSFGEVWKNVGFIGSFIYLLIQVCFLILFADEWADDWVAKMESSNGRCHLFALVSVSLLNYILSAVGLIMFYVYYGGESCTLHKWLISINLLIICALSLVAILPAVQEYNPRSGLLQASIMALYLTYLTWSALNSSPNNKCVPDLWGNSSGTGMTSQSFISLLICFSCVIYSSIRLTSQQGIQRMAGGSGIDEEASVSSESRLTAPLTSGDESGNDNDNYRNWPYFYWILALGTLYLMMTLTNWFTPTESQLQFGKSSSSLWIKMISSWFSALIYLWTLIAPVLLHEYRDFS